MIQLKKQQPIEEKKQNLSTPEKNYYEYTDTERKSNSMDKMNGRPPTKMEGKRKRSLDQLARYILFYDCRKPPIPSFTVQIS